MDDPRGERRVRRYQINLSERDDEQLLQLRGALGVDTDAEVIRRALGTLHLIKFPKGENTYDVAEFDKNGAYIARVRIF